MLVVTYWLSNGLLVTSYWLTVMYVWCIGYIYMGYGVASFWLCDSLCVLSVIGYVIVVGNLVVM